MDNPMKRFLPIILFFAATASLHSACSVFKVGKIDAVKEANELAIACKTDEALAAVNRAMQGRGLGAGIGDLLCLVIQKPDGRSRTTFFRMGRPISAGTSQADGYPEFGASKENDLHLIRVGEERYEIPDAVVLGG